MENIDRLKDEYKSFENLDRNVLLMGYIRLESQYSALKEQFDKLEKQYAALLEKVTGIHNQGQQQQRQSQPQNPPKPQQMPQQKPPRPPEPSGKPSPLKIPEMNLDDMPKFMGEMPKF